MQQIKVITTIRITDGNDDNDTHGKTTVGLAIADTYRDVSSFPLDALVELFGDLLVAVAEDYVAKKAEVKELVE